MSVGLLSSESLTGWDNLLPRWFTHTGGKLAPAVGKDPLFLSQVDPFTGLLEHPRDNGGLPPE